MSHTSVYDTDKYQYQYYKCKSIGCNMKKVSIEDDFCQECQPLQLKLPLVTKVAAVESDPSGLNAHAPGAKLDAGKPRPGLVLGGFARALLAVTRIGSYGAIKYTDNGWMEVSNGVERYDDAKLRHWLYEKSGIECDPDTNELHAAHEAWNALARLDLIIRNKEKTQ